MVNKRGSRDEIRCRSFPRSARKWHNSLTVYRNTVALLANLAKSKTQRAEIFKYGFVPDLVESLWNYLDDEKVQQ